MSDPVFPLRDRAGRTIEVGSTVDVLIPIRDFDGLHATVEQIERLTNQPRDLLTVRNRRGRATQVEAVHVCVSVPCPSSGCCVPEASR